MVRKSKIFIGIGAIVFITLVIGGIFLKGKLEEAQLQRDQEYFSHPSNMVGRWVSDDGRLSFLVYTSDVVLEPSYRIRLNLENIAFSGPSVIEGKVPTTRSYIRYMEVLDDTADTSNWLVQMEIWPLSRLDMDNNCFEARVVYHPNNDWEKCEDLGTFVFQKDTDFVEDVTGGFSQATLETIILALNDACNSYYYDAELGVMDLEFDDPGTSGIYGEGVNFDGYIHGTGIIAPIEGNVFQLGTSKIEFYIDPSAQPMRVCYLENSTLDQTIVSDCEMQ